MKDDKETKEVVVLQPKVLSKAHNIDDFAKAIDGKEMTRELSSFGDELSVSEVRRLKVRLYKIAGITNEKIAYCLGITHNGLLEHYQQDLHSAEADFTALCTNKLIQSIREGDLKALLYFLERRSRWGKDAAEDDTPMQLTKEKIEEKLREFGVDPDKIIS